MKYLGFATRQYLLKKYIPDSYNLSVLEIGVGSGSTSDFIIKQGNVEEFVGLDISAELIEYLSFEYKNFDFVKWYCLDVCKDRSNLNKQFDFVYSADTLEHVENPVGYFRFINKHLKSKGSALVTYPNESEEDHHGIIFFNTKDELLDVVADSGLKVSKLIEVRHTLWHILVKNIFWKFPKSIISGNDSKAQTFEKTLGFEIASSNSSKSRIFARYATLITRLASLFPLYKSFEPGEDISNKILLLKLEVDDDK